jgi:hypothetical protein
VNNTSCLGNNLLGNFQIWKRREWPKSQLLINIHFLESKTTHAHKSRFRHPKQQTVTENQ